MRRVCLLLLGCAAWAWALESASGQDTQPLQVPVETSPEPADGLVLPAGESAPPAPLPASESAELPLVVLETTVFGVDPVVGAHVTDQLRLTSQALGYRLVSDESRRSAVRRVAFSGYASPADLWRVTFLVSAARGVATRVWAHEGRYVFEITVASLDGTGPFFGRGTASAEEIRGAVDRALRSSLGPPDTWQQESNSAQLGSSSAGAPVTGLPAALGRSMPGRSDPVPAGGTRSGAGSESVAEEQRVALRRRFNLVFQTEGAIGTSEDMFYNHLVGGRVDYRFSQDVIAGLYLGYANLRGKNGRASNLLILAQIEDRVRVLRSSRLTIPLRLGLGYVPFNGPVVRLSAGINIPLGERFELGFDVLAPTFWVLPNRAAVSMDVAAELVWRI